MDNTLYALLNGKIGKFESLPSANADYIGRIIQYIGETSGGFTSGYFYKCTQSGSTYEWTRINVQPGGGGGTGDFDELTNKPNYNGTEMSHDTDIPEVKTQIWDNKYEKPSGGIPKTDMSSDVQTSLEKADSSLQEHQSLSAYRTASAQDAIDVTKASASALSGHTGNTTNPHNVTSEQVAYNSAATSHTSGSVAAELASQSEQIVTLANDLADEYDSTATYVSGDYAMHDGVLKKYDGSAWTEVKVTDEMGSSCGAVIDDTTTALDKVWSSQKTSTDISARYTKPVGGIPKTDFASAVQTSLGKADSSEQTANRVTSISSSSDDTHYPTAKAVFDSFAKVFNVAVNANNPEWGTVTGAGVYVIDKTVTLVATPESGYRFIKWKDAATGQSLSENATYSFVVGSNRNIVAAFVSNDIELVPWESGTDEQISAMIAAADAGAIELSDTWSVGDVRTVQLEATAADSARGIEAHSAQSVELVILDNVCTGFTVNGETPSIIVGLKNGLLETGQMNTNNTNSGGWRDSKRRSWCNTEFRSSLPSTVRSWFKQFEWSQGKGGGASSGLLTTLDYFGLAPEKCIFGNRSYSFADEAALYTQWQYYRTSTNRIKRPGASGSAVFWWESSPGSGGSGSFCFVSSDGSANYRYASGSILLAPFGCI